MNSYIKLFNGDWGIRITGNNLKDIRPGKIVQVETKDKSKGEQTIKAIVKLYDDAIICSFFQEHEQMAKFNAQDEYLKFLRERKNMNERT